MTEVFRYRAATAGGDVVEGVVRAGSLRDAADELRRQTLVPVSLESGRPAVAPRVGRSRASRRDAVTNGVRTVATLLAAGVSLERALDFAARHASHPDVSTTFRDVQADVQRGTMLSEAVRKHSSFGSFAAAVCRAGEESGTLDQALVRLADWYEREDGLRAQVLAALTYPALMGVVAGVGVVILLLFVIPRFVDILGDVGGTLPLSTRLLVGASSVFARLWWLWLLVVGGIVVGGRWWLAQPGNRKRWHAARLSWPVIGILERNRATAQFASAWGVLLNGGTPMLAALRVARDGVSNEAIAGEIEGAGERIARGERIAESLAGALPALAVELLAAGEEGGRLPEMCARLAVTHEEAAARSLRTLVRLIEPALILVFGAIVGFIALAMLQAVYSVNASVL